MSSAHEDDASMSGAEAEAEAPEEETHRDVLLFMLNEIQKVKDIMAQKHQDMSVILEELDVQSKKLELLTKEFEDALSEKYADSSINLDAKSKAQKQINETRFVDGVKYTEGETVEVRRSNTEFDGSKAIISRFCEKRVWVIPVNSNGVAIGKVKDQKTGLFKDKENARAYKNIRKCT